MPEDLDQKIKELEQEFAILQKQKRIEELEDEIRRLKAPPQQGYCPWLPPATTTPQPWLPISVWYSVTSGTGAGGSTQL